MTNSFLLTQSKYYGLNIVNYEFILVYKINNNYYYNGYEHIFDNMDLNTAIILSDDDANQFENLPLFTIAGQHY